MLSKNGGYIRNLCLYFFTDTPDVAVSVTNTSSNAVTTEVRCQAVGVPATYTYITWEHMWPGHTSVLRSFPGSEVLHLNNLTYQDSGYYTCRVENGVRASRNPGAGIGTAYLLVEGTRLTAYLLERGITSK